VVLTLVVRVEEEDHIPLLRRKMAAGRQARAAAVQNKSVHRPLSPGTSFPQPDEDRISLLWKAGRHVVVLVEWIGMSNVQVYTPDR
jgi:hypothetical protein